VVGDEARELSVAILCERLEQRGDGREGVDVLQRVGLELTLQDEEVVVASEAHVGRHRRDQLPCAGSLSLAHVCLGEPEFEEQLQLAGIPELSNQPFLGELEFLLSQQVSITSRDSDHITSLGIPYFSGSPDSHNRAASYAGHCYVRFRGDHGDFLRNARPESGPDEVFILLTRPAMGTYPP